MTQEAEHARNKGIDEKMWATIQLLQHKYQQLEEENQKLRCAAREESLIKCKYENYKT